MPNFPVKLGRKAVKRDSRTLKFGKYLTASLPAAPPARDWTRGTTDWGTMLNDQLGCCTIAGIGHGIQVWTLNTGSMFTMPDSIIERAYSAFDGYVPGDPSTDQGGVELDVLNDWKKNTHGFFVQHPLLAFADPAVQNLEEIRQAINLFGGVYIGMEVPNFMMSAEPSDVLDVVANDGGIDGGHCVFCCKYDVDTISFISWGAVYTMTNGFWNKYVDEAHALLGKNWLAAQGSPSGFDLEQLEADLGLIH